MKRLTISQSQAWKRRSKPLARRSKKTAQWYREVRVPAVIAAIGQPCAIRGPHCTHRAQGLHEPLTRARAGSARLAHEAGTVPACHSCNSWISQTVEGQRFGAEHGLLRHAL